MTKIQIDLPEEAGKALLSIADRISVAGLAPLSMEEIDAEVKAVRAERRRASVIDTSVLMSG